MDQDQDKWLFYDTSALQYTVASKIDLVFRCNGIVIKNAGTTILLVDNVDPLQPGESKSVGGNWREVYYGRHNISFAPNPFPPPGTVPTNNAIVTQKFYIPDPNPAKSKSVV